MDVKIEVSGREKIIKNVPETSWEELKPYWPLIVKSIIEVFLEGNFNPYSVRKNKQNGFYAAEWYWKQSEINPRKYSLKESKRFLKMLLKKKEFVSSIKEFNKSKSTDWTSKENIKKLRHFIYSTCVKLEELLKLLR